MMKKRIKQGSTLVLTAALAFSVLAIPKVYAAYGVDVDAECSVQINCSAQYEYDTTNEPVEKQDPFEEVNAGPVTVKLYRVASIDRSGDYKATIDGLDFSDVDSETTAAEWKAMAEAAKSKVTEANLNYTSTGTIDDESGTVTFTELKTGLYLIDAEQEPTAQYRYEFSPYLISLPNNYYSEENPNDAWDYDLIDGDTDDDDTGTTNHAIGLKPQQFDRYGYLVITKNLLNYDVTNPSAVFVFEVKATKENNVVYNDVVALDFTEPGSDCVKVGPIKAGAAVTVTEVYQGANYKQTNVESDTPLSGIIVANTYWDTCDTYKEAKEKGLPVEENTVANEEADADSTAQQYVEFTFTNEHNDIPNGGTGVVNKIVRTETAAGTSWDVEQEYQGQEKPVTPENPPAEKQDITD